ncbi:hypothetical protein NBO_46g0001 [Nosema bombycis CQ1]|uniref:Uncharacterized protein n=1 Tax=Nosema bombycis (strain CQ1 / CVCC 102059) TaxID=578461 RepID=R0KT52_NOSB1|nr:hypothetical protein NBO_46g0001 [Nosema bombycis CQ1]|eukprot:EOB13966.1 hypothetical protein NBO_46g0001 [Nosema bombycis CQ1]
MHLINYPLYYPQNPLPYFTPLPPHNPHTNLPPLHTNPLFLCQNPIHWKTSISNLGLSWEKWV